jgi:hypothetical protein
MLAAEECLRCLAGGDYALHDRVAARPMIEEMSLRLAWDGQRTQGSSCTRWPRPDHCRRSIWNSPLLPAGSRQYTPNAWAT